MELLLCGAQHLGLKLDNHQLQAFQVYYEELMAWNRRLNLTKITEYEEVQVRHFLDSLTCLLVLQNHRPTAKIVDVGTGAGFPGLPIKIALPEARLTLLEATRKKAGFLEHLVERLGLAEVRVVWARAEEAGHDPAHRERYDVALARAVSELAVLAEYALPFCQVGGLFVAQKGAEVAQEIEAAQGAITTLGGHLQRVKRVKLPGLDQPRSLVVIEKRASTPEKYPRRPGLPAKRPLR
ncbi:MAG: 16S rRNA (guanine(527)-N(7))-methyltransferase RsmG [Anaerolineae bacterium]